MQAQTFWPLGIDNAFSYSGNQTYLQEMLPLVDLSLEWCASKYVSAPNQYLHNQPDCCCCTSSQLLVMMGWTHKGDPCSSITRWRPIQLLVSTPREHRSGRWVSLDQPDRCYTTPQLPRSDSSQVALRLSQDTDGLFLCHAEPKKGSEGSDCGGPGMDWVDWSTSRVCAQLTSPQLPLRTSRSTQLVSPQLQLASLQLQLASPHKYTSAL